MLLVLGAPVICSQSSDSSTAELTRRFLQEDVFWKQHQIAEQLVAKRDPSVIPLLQPLLSDDDRHLAGNAAFVLAGLGDRRGWERLSEILHDQSVRAPRQGIAVGNFASPSPRQIEADRYYAVHLLGALKNPQALPLLAPFLKDTKVNYKIAWSLGEIGGEQAVDMLLTLLQEEDTDVRVIALYSLAKLQAKRTLPYILPLREDSRRSRFGSQETVSEAAAKAITAMQ